LATPALLAWSGGKDAAWTLHALRQSGELDVIGLPLGGLASAVGNLLAPLGPVLDGGVQPLLDLLGLKLGEADVRVHGVQCPTQGRTPVLVG
jgi:uncharacterized membrane protein